MLTNRTDIAAHGYRIDTIEDGSDERGRDRYVIVDRGKTTDCRFASYEEARDCILSWIRQEEDEWRCDSMASRRDDHQIDE